MDYINIPGYDLLYNNRETIRGGGVGLYVKQTPTHKRRKDIEEKFQDLEHVWMELPGHNKNSRLLVGVIYRSENMLSFNDWLSKFEESLGYITATWDGPIYLTGDINIDILCPSNSNTKRYLNVLNQFNLKQIVDKPTRVTKDTASLIDHIIY